MFFVYFIVAYGLVQVYCAHKTARAFGLGVPGHLLVYLLAVAMTAGPFLVWYLEARPEYHAAAVAAAWSVYGWMGFSFLFFVAGLVLDAYGLFARLTHLPRPGPVGFFMALTLLCAGLWMMGFKSAWNPEIEHLVVRSNKLPPEADGLRIAQISDVHLGVLVGREKLAGILEKVVEARPDILVSTGDLVDAQAHHLDGLSDLLAAVKPRLGKFAVTGNHEAYVGADHALAFHVRAGFTVLRGVAVNVAGIVLAGVDDPALRDGLPSASYLARVPGHRFIVLLKHQPHVEGSAPFDLQLSGHTHDGQIFPFKYLVERVHPMLRGLYMLEDGARVYVSPGAGTWGPPIRVLAPPAITLIELRRG
jgi:predicted MPP superfamily phosphohydrolase